MSPDAIINVRFLTTAEGGRLTAVERRACGFHACPLFVNGEAFDCRLLLDRDRLELGECYEMPVAFLTPSLALPKLGIGTEISLWEGRIVATGTVTQILAP